jgi:hypothetical protein
MIDTSTHKALEDLDIESIKLEKTISQQDHDKLEKDVEMITHKIVEKSDFLLRLETPKSWDRLEQE